MKGGCYCSLSCFRCLFFNMSVFVGFIRLCMVCRVKEFTGPVVASMVSLEWHLNVLTSIASSTRRAQVMLDGDMRQNFQQEVRIMKDLGLKCVVLDLACCTAVCCITSRSRSLVDGKNWPLDAMYPIMCCDNCTRS